MSLTKIEQKARKITEKILKQMYSEAVPSTSIEEAQKKDEEGKIPSYKLHYLPEDRQEEIIAEQLEDANIRHVSSQLFKKKVKTTVHLGASPTVYLDKVNENRKEAGKQVIKEETVEKEDLTIDYSHDN